MEKVWCRPLLYRGFLNIGIYFNLNPVLDGIVRSIGAYRWSVSNQCWYKPFIGEDLVLINTAIETYADLDVTEMDHYIRMEDIGDIRKPIKIYGENRAGQMVRTSRVSTANQAELEKFTQQLLLKAYSPATIRTYRNEFIQLLRTLNQHAVQSLEADDIRRYMVYAMGRLGISEHTAHSRLNALKFYFEQVLGREKFFWDIPRPKKPDLLPKIISERELERMFMGVQNLKHKALLFTAYSAGLRVSEVVSLRLSDIDSGRMQIRVALSKGKKDRYIGLSVLLLDVLRSYLMTIEPRPRVYLFEGDLAGSPYSTRSAQLIFQRARERAGIKKDVSFHVLRHSFATHMLEKGIDIRYIKDLLGHFNIQTTERYLHVRRQDLITIINPLDELFKGRSWRE